jgi:hypothetical protein
LSVGLDAVFRAAWAIWDGSGKLTLSEILLNLDSDYLEPLASLLLAISQGPNAVGLWISNEQTKGPIGTTRSI